MTFRDCFGQKLDKILLCRHPFVRSHLKGSHMPTSFISFFKNWFLKIEQATCRSLGSSEQNPRQVELFAGSRALGPYPKRIPPISRGKILQSLLRKLFHGYHFSSSKRKIPMGPLAQLFLLIPFIAEGSATSEVFAKYRNKYFIETGTLYGEGVQNALSAGFTSVYSIELSDHLYEDACRLFQSKPQVKILHGDSGELIKDILQEIDAEATFWLDGHYSGGTTAKGPESTPILRELECIRTHRIKTHTILIDDVRLFGTKTFDYISLKEIKQKILQINSRYVFSFENGIIAGDILVAQAPPSSKDHK